MKHVWGWGGSKHLFINFESADHDMQPWNRALQIAESEEGEFELPKEKMHINLEHQEIGETVLLEHLIIEKLRRGMSTQL